MCLSNIFFTLRLKVNPALCFFQGLSRQTKSPKYYLMFLFKDYFPILWQEWTDAYNALQVANGDICSDLLPNIICPTLIIQGDKDGVVSPEHPEYLEKNIKNSRSVWCHVIWSKSS